MFSTRAPERPGKYTPGSTASTIHGSNGIVSDGIRCGSSNADTEMPWFGQELLEKAEETQGIASAAYLESVDACTAAGLVELERGQADSVAGVVWQLPAGERIDDPGVHVRKHVGAGCARNELLS